MPEQALQPPLRMPAAMALVQRKPLARLIKQPATMVFQLHNFQARQQPASQAESQIRLCRYCCIPCWRIRLIPGASYVQVAESGQGGEEAQVGIRRQVT